MDDSSIRSSRSGSRPQLKRLKKFGRYRVGDLRKVGHKGVNQPATCHTAFAEMITAAHWGVCEQNGDCLRLSNLGRRITFGSAAVKIEQPLFDAHVVFFDIGPD